MSSERKTFEYRGIWWLPENPQKKLTGVLVFDQDSGGILELDGWFKEITDINTILQPSIILGFTKEGKRVTLCKNAELQTKYNMPGLPVSSFSTLTILEGKHFLNTEDIKFKKISVSYSYLDEWLDIHAFDFGDWINQNPQQINEVTIKYCIPKAIKAQISNDLYLEIVFRPQFNFATSGQQFANINQRIFVNVYFSTTKSYDEIMGIHGKIKDFISLAVLESTKVLSLEADIAEETTGEAQSDLKDLIKVFCKSSQITDFKNKAVDTRNYMTHYDLSLKDKASKGADLWKLVKELEILVEVCLLSEIGFTNTQIKNLFQRTQRYKFLNQAT